MELPGSQTVPELMGNEHRTKYQEALEAADKGNLNLLIELIELLVGLQIQSMEQP